MDARFAERILTEAQIRDLLGAPKSHVLSKVTATLDHLCRDFITRCPFVLIASSDRDGNMDLSPKGDPPGFVRVLDEATLAIPDRRGNRRADTMRNILQRSRVALLFLVPGRGETLRVSGAAMIVRDQWLLQEMALGNETPQMALIVKVTEVFFHCPKCVARSGLWEPPRWPDVGTLASFAHIKTERA
jgi:PPOX class probable FMN-dependent enzyme